MGYIGIVGLIVTLVRSSAAESGRWLPTLVRLLIIILAFYALYFICIFSPPGRKLGEKFARYREQKNANGAVR
jgi:hypothetical protein